MAVLRQNDTTTTTASSSAAEVVADQVQMAGIDDVVTPRRRLRQLKMDVYTGPTTTTPRSSSRSLASTPIKRKKGDCDEGEDEDDLIPSQKEARVSQHEGKGAITDENKSSSDVTQTDIGENLGVGLEGGFTQKDNCELESRNSIQDNSNTSNEISSHFSSQKSPRHHRGKPS